MPSHQRPILQLISRRSTLLDLQTKLTVDARP